MSLQLPTFMLIVKEKIRFIPTPARIVIAALVAILVYTIIWVASQFREPPGIGWPVLLLIAISYLTFEIVSRVQQCLFQRKLSTNTSINLVLGILGAVSIGVIAYSVMFYGFKWLDYWLMRSEPPYAQHMVTAALIGMIMSLVFALIQLGFNWRSEYFKSQLENEQFKGEIAQANLSILKHQLDPHFMFNNFNTLYYLIEEDSELARSFLKNISTIYRYILQNHDKVLIPAVEEYEMARQYLAVIQQRYADHFTLQDETSGEVFKERDLPPLVLQQLIENAVKHNRIDEDSPLHLTLSNSHQYLTVTNTLNLKRAEVTAKTGLENIRKRYQYLTGLAVQVEQTDKTFSVSIPLINTHA